MASNRHAAGLVLMTSETRGNALKSRAEDLGIFTVRDLERATERVGRKVPRASISKAFQGTASEAIYLRLESALDLLDEEMSSEGGEPGTPGVIRFTLHNVYGVGEVIAEGPPENREELVESLAKLLRDLREED